MALPGPGQSFAWMYSIEDPSAGGAGNFAGIGAQVRMQVMLSLGFTTVPHSVLAHSGEVLAGTCRSWGRTMDI